MALLISYILTLQCQIFQTKLEVINIFLVEEKTFFDCLQSDQTFSSYINSNLYNIKEWFVMTLTEGIYTLIVNRLPQEASTIGQRFSF